jgi:hypothetical protein
LYKVGFDEQGTYKVAIILIDDKFETSRMRNSYNFEFKLYFYVNTNPLIEETEDVVLVNDTYLDWSVFNQSKMAGMSNGYRLIAP